MVAAAIRQEGVKLTLARHPAIRQYKQPACRWSCPPNNEPNAFFPYPATPFIVLSPSGNRLWAYREKENFRSSMVVGFRDWRRIVWFVIDNWGESIVEDGTEISKERGRESLQQIVSNDRYLQSGVCQVWIINNLMKRKVLRNYEIMKLNGEDLEERRVRIICSEIWLV